MLQLVSRNTALKLIEKYTVLDQNANRLRWAVVSDEVTLDYFKLNKCLINALVLIIINFNLSFCYKDATKVIKRRLRNYDNSIIK